MKSARAATRLLAGSWPALGLACFSLAACNGTTDVYRHGPWGRMPYAHERPTLYSSPWGVPNGEIDIALPVNKPLTPRPHAEPLEELGPDIAPSRIPFKQSVLKAESKKPVEAIDTSATTVTPERTASALGAWMVQEGKSACRLHLSSTPTLDLYKASTSGCTNPALQAVNTWRLRDGTIALYAKGKPVARLSGDGLIFSGTLIGQNATITLTR